MSLRNFNKLLNLNYFNVFYTSGHISSSLFKWCISYTFRNKNTNESIIAIKNNCFYFIGDQHSISVKLNYE
jgi:hypothetical protein